MKFVRRQLPYEFKKVSQWESDKKFEETSIAYLEQKTSILDDLNCLEIIQDKDRQLKGIDLICHIPKKFNGERSIKLPQNVDVKSIAGLLPTFSFEISGSVSTNQIGWLINDDYETTYYLLVYHVLRDGVSTGTYTKDKNLMSLDNVKYTKSILINKKQMMSYILSTMGLTSKNYKDMIKSVRFASEGESDICRFIYEDGVLRKKRKDEKSNIVITCSKQLKEEPVNIILSRRILEKIADRIWEVHDNGLKA